MMIAAVSISEALSIPLGEESLDSAHGHVQVDNVAGVLDPGEFKGTRSPA